MSISLTLHSSLCTEDLLEKPGKENSCNSGAYRITIKWQFVTLMHCAGKKSRTNSIQLGVFATRQWYSMDVISFFFFF